MPEEEEYDEGQNKDGLTRDPSLSVSDNAQSGWGDKYFQNSLAKNVGRNAEKNAAGNVVKFPGYGRSTSEKKDGGTGGGNVVKGDFTSARQDAKSAEEKGGFVNNVQGKAIDAAMSGVPGGKIASKQLKKLGPAGLILAIVAVLMIVFSGTQTLAPFGLVANGLDQFNNLRTSMNTRNKFLAPVLLNTKRSQPKDKGKVFGKKYFKLKKDDDITKKLKSNKVSYFTEDDGFNTRFLVYTDEDSHKTYAVAADDADVASLPDSVEIDGKKVEISKNGKMELNAALGDSDNFSTSMSKGTRTVKGHIAGWFDTLSSKFHLRIRNSRNKQKNTKKNASDEDVVSAAKSEGLDEGIKGDGADEYSGDKEADRSKENETFESCSKDGCSYYESPEGIADDGGVSKDSGGSSNSADIEKKITTSLTGKVSSIVGAGGKIADVGCSVMKAYSAINAIAAAMHTAQVLNYTTGFLEAIQKTEAGDAGKMELSHYMTGLSQKGKTVDSQGNIVKGKENTSSLESPAWNQFFSDGNVVLKNDDPVAEKFNREYAMKHGIENFSGISVSRTDGFDFVHTAKSKFTDGVTAYKTCLVASSASAVASDVLDVVFAFVSGGTSEVIKSVLGDSVASILHRVLIPAIVNIAISAIASTVIPHIAKMLTTDLISNMAGEDAAYAINSGFNIYSGQQLQMSSGLPATEDKLMAHYRAQQDVIASEGEYERSQRSPFDPTSKYTFVGSIVNSLMPVANTLSSPLTTVSKISTITGDYLSSLLPTAKADGEVKFKTSLNKDCPNLKNIGVMGDAFCNPYIVTDMSTISEDPLTVYKKAEKTKDVNNDGTEDSTDNFLDDDDEGNPQINPEGAFAKWILSCAVRDSGFGTVDSNVMSAITTVSYTGNSTVNDIVDSGISSLPIVGTVKDIQSNAAEMKNIGWATGEKCVQDKYKYFSRYSEDQRMMESLGIIKKSSISAFLDKYYEENPIDNSLDGTIARYSGMSKEDVDETIALVNYYNFVANYNPDGFGPVELEKHDNMWRFEQRESNGAVIISMASDIVYDDLREQKIG